MYELDKWSQDSNSDFTLKDCLCGGVKLAENATLDKYIYSGYDVGFDSHSLSSLPNFDWGKNVIIFGVDTSSPVHNDYKKKYIYIYILTLGEGPTQGLDYTRLILSSP